MEADTDKDWKKRVGFPINYDSGQSSEDDFDTRDVVMRHPRQSSGYLLADGGDGAEADVLGSTPPRARIRDKEKRRTYMDSESSLQRVLRDKKNSSENSYISEPPATPDRLKKRASLKLIRSRERDFKQDMGQRPEHRADSLPSPNPMPAIPTLVESCSRFMSLTSRLKCRETVAAERSLGVGIGPGVGSGAKGEGDDELPPSRVAFHQTFSMLINMGNMDKGCRRTISREEQVWQNELKDLIWLELQARLAGRSLPQQDAFLCAQRGIVPATVQNIIDYRFVNSNPCKARSQRLCTIEGSREDLTAEHSGSKEESEKEGTDDEDLIFGCLSFDCQPCSDAIGKAMREVGTLLDSFYNAVSLYPSSKAMTVEHPLVATQLFKNRIKAMCLWYNIAMHLRLKLLSVRRLLRTLCLKSQRRGMRHLASTDSDISRQSSECQRQCQVRFNISNNPTDSSNSDSSSQSEQKEEVECQEKGSASEDQGTGQVSDSHDEGSPENNHGEDEIDSGLEKNIDQNGATTPEIVISDSMHGTNDTTVSTESGYASPAERDLCLGIDQDDVYAIGSLRELTALRLLGKCAVSPYRTYHYEMLKTQGVRRCMMFVNKMRKHVLHKVYHTLERPDGSESETCTEDDPVEVFIDTKDEDEKTDYIQDEDAQKTYELRRYGCWSEESIAMCLPSYRSHFLFLCSICLEAVHDYLTLRLEGRPDHPSCLTVKQLIHELKEGLDIATEMRATYVRNVRVVLRGRRADAAARADLLLLLRTFDVTVDTVLKQYLSYLRTMSEVEHMSRSCLETEWSFTAQLAQRTTSAAQLAPDAFTDIACNQLQRLLKQFEMKFGKLSEQNMNTPENNRELVYALCREAQSLYASEREGTMQAVQWARSLSARLARAAPPACRPQRARIYNSLMSIRDCIVNHTELVLERSRVAPTDEFAKEITEGLVARVRELLLQIYKLGFELHKELYNFARAPYRLLNSKHLRRQRPVSLQPLRSQTTDYRRRRPETMIINESLNPTIHKELHRFVNEPSCGRFGSRRSVVGTPPRARYRYLRAESTIEDGENNVFDDINSFADNQGQTSIELLLSGEPQKEKVEIRQETNQDRGVSDEEQQWAAKVSRAIIQFARCWMKFVMERCDRGRGLRPRWASQGLEFLMLACDPYNTKHLSNDEFEELKQLMDECISHVIGSRPTGPRPPELTASPTPARSHRHRIHHSPLSSSSTGSASREVPAPPTPPSEPDPLLSFTAAEPTGRTRRVVEAARRIDEERDKKLRDMKAVGRVLESAVTSYEPKLRQVTFKWQRGLKIGAGTFGKVYTVVNTESGQLLAMKELSIGVGDRRALQRAANELRVLEGVIHPHLVRYYGCEVHREEMLIFMELCVEGSLESLIVGTGALAEPTVRRYTKQLLSAVLELHKRNIVHRDIKSGNIFLTNEGHCLKLGDFGSAVKIRANTTAAGELQGCVGTQAYMAPEVFMKSSGHGRAADIWSLGCVVTEMASGKRPFSEYDSNYQIMFVVGMGGRPHIPDSLSEEGRQFCIACLTHDPDLRPKAEALNLHHFLMVKSDEDCHCEPGFLIQ